MLRPTIVLTAAILTLVAADPSEAARRPTTDTVDDCMIANPSGEYGCGGLICSCCYDEGPEKGCWICDDEWNNCVWDPAYRSGEMQVSPDGQGSTRPPRFQQVLPTNPAQTLGPSDQQPVRPRLPEVRTPGTLQQFQQTQ